LQTENYLAKKWIRASPAVVMLQCPQRVVSSYRQLQEAAGIFRQAGYSFDNFWDFTCYQKLLAF